METSLMGETELGGERQNGVTNGADRGDGMEVDG